MIRLVVFDCDGTLVDSQHAIIAAMRQAFADNSLRLPEPEAVRQIVGLSLLKAMEALVPDAMPEQHRALERDYRRAFQLSRQREEHREALYPGAAETVAALDAAGYLLGVATGKGRRGLRTTLERYGLDGHFVTLQTAEDAPSKPHPGMLERAMAEVGVAPHETVLVGDTVFDIEMAVNAGAAPIGVRWGYHDAALLSAAGARAIVETFDALPSVIANLVP